MKILNADLVIYRARMKNIKPYSDFLNESLEPSPKMPLSGFNITAGSQKINYAKLNSDFKRGVLSLPAVSGDSMIKQKLNAFKADDPGFLRNSAEILAAKGIEVSLVDNNPGLSSSNKILAASLKIPNTDFHLDVSKGYGGVTFSKKF